ncbi:MAG: hypothetical protein F6K03_13715, partial [Kamptonema sp. SIO4C4]|nr:hypothetical protein [Kamptonema sp. SIO4C4]
MREEFRLFLSIVVLLFKGAFILFYRKSLRSLVTVCLVAIALFLTTACTSDISVEPEAPEVPQEVQTTESSETLEETTDPQTTDNTASSDTPPQAETLEPPEEPTEAVSE